MRHRLIIPLKPSRAYPAGKTLIAEYVDRDTATAALRSMEWFRQKRWGLPEILVETLDGERWCLGYCDIVWKDVVLEPAPAAVPAS
jgi:hypothetical protein